MSEKEHPMYLQDSYNHKKLQREDTLLNDFCRSCIFAF
ncbi:hypothetical protein CP10139811_0598 [Chlamydia ibidis]|uniref:Uncharacterized protein n=2 Tax=Chlamydia ibidis TaxID=1405396 RepID=S7J2G1_9CHLA|nr:hypothetical protein CP10139811_0598 [Chlamydia ibidis]EQM62460.1 hypothetical protein H359_0979 [Chlamydia ibidis 10-1398/6]